MPSKFHNRDGTLTTYALACGYIEVADRPSVHTKLSRDGACYHIISISKSTHCRIWESFPLGQLKAARREFRRQSRLIEVV